VVKLFLAGVVGFILIVFGVIAAVITPLVPSVQQNLGGAPQSPFHIPQPLIDAFRGVFGAATPEVILFGSLSVGALLMLYMVATLIAALVMRHKTRQAEEALLGYQGRMNALRVSGQPHRKKRLKDQSELEQLWK